MRRIQLKTVLFLFRLLLLILIYYHYQFTLVAAIENNSGPNLHNELANTAGENGMNLNERMKQMEDRSRRQEQEIVQLTTNAVIDRKVINQLKDRVAQLEEASSLPSSLVRSKRLYRLLPITHDGKGDTDNKEQINLQFYGPATNCDELGKLGYTLNGYYLVKNKGQDLESSRGNIDVVHCLFQQPLKGSIKKDIKEERYGPIVFTSSMKLSSNQHDRNEMSATVKTTSQSQDVTSSYSSLAKYYGSTTEGLWATSKLTYSPSTRMSSVFGSSKLISVNEKEGKSFLLKNKRNKCMSSGILNKYGPYESNCNPNEKEQHWKWCGDKNICNHLGKFLSMTHVGSAADGNGKMTKMFSISLSGFDQSNFADQIWRATNVGQIMDIENGLCLGVAYNSVDRQHLLITVKSCDLKDDGQFWSFDSILTPTSISTSRPQVMGNNFPEKSISHPAIEASEMIPLIRKDGKSYLLKNKRNKCMSSGFLNRRSPYEDNCDPKDKYQHWRWCEDNKLCNHLGKFLSKEYLGLDTYPNRTTEKSFRIKLLESSSSKDVVQKWSVTGLGQLVDIEDGLCLGVSYNSVDLQHLQIAVKSCDKQDGAQFWFFANIWAEVSISTLNPKSPVIEPTKLVPLKQKDDGKSYHVVNKHNKCISSKSINELEVGAIQSNCNAKESRQLWKWSGHSLCSDFGCLSKVQKHGQNFQVLLGEENYDSPWVNQNWSTTVQGQLLSRSGLCLGAEQNYYSHDNVLTVESCNKNRNGQIWSFTTI